MKISRCVGRASELFKKLSCPCTQNNSEHESNSQSAHQRSPSAQLPDRDEEPESPPYQEDSEDDADNSDSGPDFDAMHFDVALNNEDTTSPERESDNGESDSRSPSPPPEPLLEHIALTKKFIEAISDAKLESSGLDRNVLDALLNPTDKDPLDLLDADTRFSIDLYMACRGVSQRVYEDACKVVMRRIPEVKLLSHYLVKKVVADVTGIVAHIPLPGMDVV